MTDSERGKAELLEEIKKLRARNAELEIDLSESRRETESLRDNFELTCRRREGDSFPGNLNIRTISDGEDRLLYLEGCIDDITERKQAEEALNESQ